MSKQQRNRSSSPQKKIKGPTAVVADKTVPSKKEQTQILHSVGAMFKDQIETDVIQMVLIEKSWQVDTAVEFLSSMVPETRPKSESFSEFDLIAFSLLDTTQASKEEIESQQKILEGIKSSSPKLEMAANTLSTSNDEHQTVVSAGVITNKQRPKAEFAENYSAVEGQTPMLPCVGQTTTKSVNVSSNTKNRKDVAYARKTKSKSVERSLQKTNNESKLGTEGFSSDSKHLTSGSQETTDVSMSLQSYMDMYGGDFGLSKDYEEYFKSTGLMTDPDNLLSPEKESRLSKSKIQHQQIRGHGGLAGKDDLCMVQENATKIADSVSKGKQTNKALQEQDLVPLVSLTDDPTSEKTKKRSGRKKPKGKSIASRIQDSSNCSETKTSDSSDLQVEMISEKGNNSPHKILSKCDQKLSTTKPSGFKLSVEAPTFHPQNVASSTTTKLFTGPPVFMTPIGPHKPFQTSPNQNRGTRLTSYHQRHPSIQLNRCRHPSPVTHPDQNVQGLSNFTTVAHKHQNQKEKSPLQLFRQYMCDDKLTLVLLRGLPGSGKSYLARDLVDNGIILSTDDYFIKAGVYLYDPNELSAAHTWNKQRAINAMEAGINPVIIDNTNTKIWEMKPYAKSAMLNGYNIIIMEPQTAWKFKPRELVARNTHGVSREIIMKMKERYDNIVTVEQLLQTDKPMQKLPDHSLATQRAASSTCHQLRKSLSPSLKSNHNTNSKEDKISNNLATVDSFKQEVQQELKVIDLATNNTFRPEVQQEIKGVDVKSKNSKDEATDSGISMEEGIKEYFTKNKTEKQQSIVSENCTSETPPIQSTIKDEITLLFDSQSTAEVFYGSVDKQPSPKPKRIRKRNRHNSDINTDKVTTNCDDKTSEDDTITGNKVDTQEDAIPIKESESTIAFKEVEPTISLKDAEHTIPLKDAEPTILLKDAEPSIPLKDAESTILLKDAESTILLKDAEPTILLKDVEPTIPLKDAESKSTIPSKDAEPTVPLKDVEPTISLKDAESTISDDQVKLTQGVQKDIDCQIDIAAVTSTLKVSDEVPERAEGSESEEFFDANDISFVASVNQNAQEFDLEHGHLKCTDMPPNNLEISDDHNDSSEDLNENKNDNDNKLETVSSCPNKTLDDLDSSGKSESNSDSLPNSPRRRHRRKKRNQTPFIDKELKLNFKTTNWNTYTVEDYKQEATLPVISNQVDRNTESCDASTSTDGVDLKFLDSVNSGKLDQSFQNYKQILKVKGRDINKESLNMISSVAIGRVYGLDKGCDTSDLGLNPEPNLEFLKNSFPELSYEQHLEILNMCQNDVEWAINLILDCDPSVSLTTGEKKEIASEVSKLKRETSVSINFPDSLDLSEEGASVFVDFAQPKSLFDICNSKIKAFNMDSKEIQQNLIKNGMKQLEQMETHGLQRMKSVSCDEINENLLVNQNDPKIMSNYNRQYYNSMSYMLNEDGLSREGIINKTAALEMIGCYDDSSSSDDSEPITQDPSLVIRPNTSLLHLLNPSNSVCTDKSNVSDLPLNILDSAIVSVVPSDNVNLISETDVTVSPLDNLSHHAKPVDTPDIKPLNLDSKLVSKSSAKPSSKLELESITLPSSILDLASSNIIQEQPSNDLIGEDASPVTRDISSPVDGVQTELSLKLSPTLVSQLEQLFGQITSHNGLEEEEVFLDFKAAKHLHRCLKNSHKSQMTQLKTQIQHDEALARKIQKEENNQGVKRKKYRQPVYLEDIIQEELDRKTTRDKHMKYLEATGDHIAIATKLKRQKLLQKYPGLDESFFEDIFQANGYSYEDTESAIKAAIGPIPSETDYYNTLLEEVKQNSLVEMFETPLLKTRKKTDYQNMECLETDYREVRGEADLHHRLRQQCFVKAREAFQRGMKDVSSFYSQQGHLHTKKVKEANMRASQKILESRQLKVEKDMTLDLHGFHVDEAISVLSTVLQQKEREFSTRPERRKQNLYVITGRGLNSRGGVAKIRPAIHSYLRSNNIKFTEEKPGLLNIQLKYKPKT